MRYLNMCPLETLSEVKILICHVLDHYYEDEDFDQVNEDIDHTVLNKIVLSKYETVASDDEDDDGYVSIVSGVHSTFTKFLTKNKIQ